MNAQTSNTDIITSSSFEETTRDFLQSLSAGAMVDPRIDGMDAFRRHASQLQLNHAIAIPHGVSIENLTICGRNGDIPIRTYRGKGENAASPTLVYLHGGAWVLGGLDEYDGVCGFIAQISGATVVSVDYRLAPEHKFPAAVEDCYDAAYWAYANISSLGGDETKFCIAGDSAGGNLAAVICQLARQKDHIKIARQLLFYPCLAQLDVQQYPSRAAYGTPENFLNEDGFQYMLSLYIRSGDDENDPRLWPIINDNLCGLPDAYIVTAECDMLRDEAHDYAKKLKNAGVSVVEKKYLKTIHGFMGFAGTIRLGENALDDASCYLRSW